MASRGRIAVLLFGLGLFFFGGLGLGLILNDGPVTELQPVSYAETTDDAVPAGSLQGRAASPQVSLEQSFPAMAADGEGGFAEIAAKVTPAVVNVFSERIVMRRDRMSSPFHSDPFFNFFGRRYYSVPRARRETSLGSGVIVHESGIVLTNNHVIEGAEEIQVALADGRKLKAELLGTDPATDVAVLKIEASGLPTLELADSDSARIGDLVLAIGNPFGLGQTVTMGIISATGRSDMGIVDYEDFIQTDAAINPGNSGGALIDTHGRLLGINTAIFSRSGGYQGIGFAIPINIARTIMQSITTTGGVSRGWLGVSFQDIDEGIMRAFDLSSMRGALVNEIDPDSPADHGGLRRGDVITEFDGQIVSDAVDLRRRIALAPVGQQVVLTFIRGGKIRHARVVVQQQTLEYTYLSERSEQWVSPIEGVVVEALDRRSAQRAGLKTSSKGVLVKNILGRSPAAASGLQTGDIILEINRAPVSSVDEFKRLVAKFEGKTVILLVSRGGRLYYLSLPS